MTRAHWRREAPDDRTATSTVARLGCASMVVWRATANRWRWHVRNDAVGGRGDTRCGNATTRRRARRRAERAAMRLRCAYAANIVEASGEWAADFARYAAELKAREPEIIRSMIGDALAAEAPSSSLALASLHDDVRRRYAFPLTTPEHHR